MIDILLLLICGYFFVWEGLRYVFLLFVWLWRRKRVERYIMKINHSRNIYELELWEGQAEAAVRDLEKMTNISNLLK